MKSHIEEKISLFHFPNVLFFTKRNHTVSEPTPGREPIWFLIPPDTIVKKAYLKKAYLFWFD